MGVHARWFGGLLAGLVSLSLMAPPAQASQPPDSENPRIVQVTVKSKQELKRLARLGLDMPTRKGEAVTVLVRDSDFPALKRLGYPVKDSGRRADDELRAFAARAGADMGRYHTYAEVKAELEAAVAKFPKICSMEVIGKSFEGRDIYGIRVSGLSVEEGKKPKTPRGIFMGLHHSREWISVEVPMGILAELTSKYGKDDKITKLVDSRVTWIVPIVNPDGHIYSQTSYKMWRKNRNKNDGKQIGVDLNRNYGWHWGLVGASDYMGSDTYHGKKPFSETESSAIKALEEREHFTVHISFHSYSELNLYPMGYEYEPLSDDDKLLNQLGNEMTKLNNYTTEKSSDLYPAMGDSEDWANGACGALSFTIELASSFIPAESQVDGIVKDNVAASLHLLSRAGEVHSVNHPEFASGARVQISKIRYFSTQFATASGGSVMPNDEPALASLSNDIATAQKNLEAALDPKADHDGSALREAVDLYHRLDGPAKPIVGEALTRVSKSLGAAALRGDKEAGKRFQITQSELGR